MSSYNSTGVILCGVIKMGEVPGCNSIPKSTTLCGGSPGSSSRKTSTYSHTTRGKSKSGLSSSSRVRLASQPANCPCCQNTIFFIVTQFFSPANLPATIHYIVLRYNLSPLLCNTNQCIAIHFQPILGASLQYNFLYFNTIFFRAFKPYLACNTIIVLQ